MPYIPRLNGDSTYRNPYYTTKNPFYNAGYPMPNCTAYAWGRFWENADINGDFSNRPLLSTGNADSWFNHSDPYARGNTPALGAIACYSGGNFSGEGHVCVLERDNGDGTWLVSESGWNAWYFRASHSIQANGDYGYGGYHFQGYIYNPVVGGGAISPAPAGWTWQPRLTREGMAGNPYYYRLNAWWQHNHPLPHCECYAWGRWFEAMDIDRTYSDYFRPVLKTSGNASTWWGYTQDGYARGSTPEIGAIICFDNNGGHVAVVEEISDDGLTLTCSNSGYLSKRYFYISHVHWNGTTWHWNNSYDFQGFIYNPFVHGGGISWGSRRPWLYKHWLWNREGELIK